MSNAKSEKSDKSAYMLFIEGAELKEEHPMTFKFSPTQLKSIEVPVKLTLDLLNTYAKKVNPKIKAQLVQNLDGSVTLTIELDDKSVRPNDKPRQLKQWLMKFRNDFEVFYGSERFPQELANNLISTLRLESKGSQYPLMVLPRKTKIALAFLDEKARDAAANRLCIPPDQILTITTRRMTHNHFILASIPNGLTAEKYVQSMMEFLEPSQYKKQPEPPEPTIPEGHVVDTEYRYDESVAKVHPELKLSVLKQ